MAGGRPTKYDPKMCDQVIDCMAEGMSKIETAGTIGITSETLYQWVQKYPEFSDAVKLGVELSNTWWERKGRINLENKDFNATLFYMNMKNRFKWADRQETDVTSKGEKISVNITL